MLNILKHSGIYAGTTNIGSNVVVTLKGGSSANKIKNKKIVAGTVCAIFGGVILGVAILGGATPALAKADADSQFDKNMSDKDIQQGSLYDDIGREVSLLQRLPEGFEVFTPVRQLIKIGEEVFTAKWTPQEGGGRPFSNGLGGPLADPNSPLVFPRNFNRISAPDGNSCAGCHNDPIIGGGGDQATAVFVLGQRFDFASFDQEDSVMLRGTINEQGEAATFQNIANMRRTTGLHGAGFIEMLARQMTVDLRNIRDAVLPGEQVTLATKGINFGVLKRDLNGAWDVSGVEGLVRESLVTTGPNNPPSLIIMPWFQSGVNVSIRQFTVGAFNHHHGIQPSERVGDGVDKDGDGVADELTRAEVTAVSIFQATLPVPVEVLPKNPVAKRYARKGKKIFSEIECATCHTPALPLVDHGWVYTEPGPFNPKGTLNAAEGPVISVDLTRFDLPQPRLTPDAAGRVWVPAYTDLKLHDITSGPDDPNRESIDQSQLPGTPAFFEGNGRFVTRRLWGVADSAPYMHHGKFTTMREAILAHSGEALASREAFEALSEQDADAVIEFLKTLKLKR